jgi:hypothetical protein
VTNNKFIGDGNILYKINYLNYDCTLENKPPYYMDIYVDVILRA